MRALDPSPSPLHRSSYFPVHRGAIHGACCVRSSGVETAREQRLGSALRRAPTSGAERWVLCALCTTPQALCNALPMSAHRRIVVSDARAAVICLQTSDSASASAHVVVVICASLPRWMLKRAPTRLELRGEGADQIEQEYQQAKEERQAQSAQERSKQRAQTQQQQSQQQPPQSQLQSPPPRTPQPPVHPSAVSTSVRSSPLNQSSSSFFSIDQ